jgi:hypothetical protein
MKMKTIVILAGVGFVSYKIMTSKPMKLYIGALLVDAAAGYLKKKLK